MLLREIVYVRLLIPFCLGIVSFIFLPVHPGNENVLIAFFLCVGLLLASHYYLVTRKALRYGWLGGIAAHTVFYLAGYLLCAQHTEINKPQHFSYFISKESWLLLQVDEPLAETEKTYKTVCKVIAVEDSAGLHPVTGKVQIYLRKDSTAVALNYGDRLVAKNKFAELHAPENPGEFNYKRFMGYRQIYHQAFLNKKDWMLTESTGGNPLIASVLHLRNNLLGILRKYVKDEQAFAVSSSLILGMREKMDDDLVKAYSSSGTLHILSVSGLHVAIMFQLFGYALFFLNRNSRSQVVKSVIILLLIWLYAVLTGLSPAVMRAAVMFTFIGFGTMKRITNIYNVVACSAFALLLYNPYYLMEVGFQLSYIAVLGIVLLHPKIYSLLYARNWLVNEAWIIIAVSLAAQLATFPLALLYFYQFPVYFLISNLIVIPVYFLISNLIVIPVSTGILYLGVILFGLCWVPVVNDTLGYYLEWLLRFMNNTVLYIDSLPFALWQGVHVNAPQVWLIYLTILALVAFIYWKRNELIVASLACIVLLLGLNGVEHIQNTHQRKLVVYSVSRNTAIDFISGTRHLFVGDNALLQDDKRMSFHIKHNWWDNGLRGSATDITQDFSLPFVKREKEYVQFLDKRIVLLDEPKKITASEKLTVDEVILSKNVKVKMDDLVKMYNLKRVIFDSSNTPAKVKRWKLDCEKLGLEYYDVNESGAYVENL